jgi:hypothetical protein
MADPVHGQADDRPSDDGQVHDGIAGPDATAVLTSNHIESEMKAGFNAPVSAVGFEHLLSIHLCRGARAQQVLGFYFLGWFAGAVDAAGQPSGLLCEGKGHSRRSGIKGDEATSFGPATIEFTGLNDGRLVPRGKMRPTAVYRAVARYRRHRIDCL